MCSDQPECLFIFYGIKQNSNHFENTYTNNNNFESFFMYEAALPPTSDMMMSCINHVWY